MRGGLRSFEGDQGVLQTKDGRSLRGVLSRVHRDCVVMANFVYLDEAQPHDLPGEAVVPVANVSWFHRVSAGAAP